MSETAGTGVRVVWCGMSRNTKLNVYVYVYVYVCTRAFRVGSGAPRAELRSTSLVQRSSERDLV